MNIILYIFYHAVPPPNITVYLVSQTVLALENATFSRSATGYNVRYHWISGSGPISDKGIGRNNHTLTIPSVEPSDDDTYICVASNEGGNVTSNAVQLTVIGTCNQYMCTLQ